MPNGIARRTFSLNVFLSRAPDVEGQWLGHCLEVDVVTQGDSMHHAYAMAREAVEMVILDDLNAGREPTLRAAPPEEWEAVYRLVRSSGPKLYTLEELFANERKLTFALAPLILNVEAVPNVHPVALQELAAHPLVQAA